MSKHWTEKAEKLNVPIEGRWENGINHHPEANTLVRDLADIDFHEYDDYFCWKVGGDGDNGEALMEQMSVLFEIRDAELSKKYLSTMDMVRAEANEHKISLLEAAIIILNS